MMDIYLAIDKSGGGTYLMDEGRRAVYHGHDPKFLWNLQMHDDDSVTRRCYVAVGDNEPARVIGVKVFEDEAALRAWQEGE